jgi:hypothetical protein
MAHTGNGVPLNNVVSTDVKWPGKRREQVILLGELSHGFNRDELRNILLLFLEFLHAILLNMGTPIMNAGCKILAMLIRFLTLLTQDTTWAL